jgi:PLP dependent protein
MNFLDFKNSVESKGATLVAVSKTKPIHMIQELYDQGQRIFGENKVQEILDKKEQLPTDIQWHMIGHLQTNKVKALIPHVSLIHGVDSLKLLNEINKEAKKINLKVNVLLQMFIAQEETKFGLSQDELNEIINIYNSEQITHVCLCGLMGMASFTDNAQQVNNEFSTLKNIFDETFKQLTKNKDDFKTISMGMSGDYESAITHGSTMVRIGSLLFGSRHVAS